MILRSAKISDAAAIHALISEYAELDRMLFRSMADIYESILTFVVAEEDGVVLSCGALSIISRNLAEIKSLAVSRDAMGKGIGRAVVAELVKKSSELGIEKVFALTLETNFFLRCGFDVVSKEQLPMKVWSDCASCPKQANCDETAVIINVRSLDG
ncbi:MAG: N-acetyltransferase [Phycisphaerae bacterium]|jgi:amino-acid N-acetyltransferase